MSDAGHGVKVGNGAVHSDHFEPLTATLAKYKAAIEQVHAQVEQPLDPLFASDPGLTYRFLRGWKFDLPTTVARVNTAQRYRRQHGLAAVREKAVQLQQQQFPHAERILRYWPHVILHGHDRRGQPLSIERLGHSNPAVLCQAVTLEELMLYHHYHMENKGALFSRLSVETDTVMRACKIMDLQGLGRQHLTTRGIAYFKAVIAASQDNYPETMGSLFIINAPWVFSVAWRMLQPLLNENTLDKIHILGSGYQQQLQQYIDPKFIPVEFGGSCTCNGKGCVPLYNPEDDMTKLQVKAGSSFTHRLQVRHAASASSTADAAGMLLTYELRVHSHDIAFSITATRADGRSVVLVPAARIGHGEFVSSAVSVDSGSEVQLVFDNQYSRFTSKTLWFRCDLSEIGEEEAAAGKEIAVEEERRSPRAAAADGTGDGAVPLSSQQARQ